MARMVGIRHRVKSTTQGESRPTMVAVRDGGALTVYQLETETDELDFLQNRFPTAYRTLEPGEDVENFLPRHVRHTRRRAGGGDGEPTIRVPAAYDGLKPGDSVAMVLGGSGDRFAYALSRHGQDIGARVIRIPPFTLDKKRGSRDKNEDHSFLAELAISSPEFFYEVQPRTRDLIATCEAFRAYRDAQKDRIRCEQRLYQRTVGQIFLSPEGKYPEGRIEDEYDLRKASDERLHAVTAEERELHRELFQQIRPLDVWPIFESIIGMGERIAAGIIASIGDIWRFRVETDYTGCVSEQDFKYARRKALEHGAGKFKRYCGLHVNPDGTFPRKRRGMEGPMWPGEARQAFFLLGQQFNYHPESKWGQALLRFKAELRKRHPEPMKVSNKEGKEVTRYSDAHIHRMATWRTLTRFAEKLYFAWMGSEEYHRLSGQ